MSTSETSGRSISVLRYSLGNKLSFMGTYGKDILIPKTPYILPQICFVIFYKNIKSGDSFSISLKDPSGKVVGKKLNGSIPEEVKSIQNFTMLAKFAPLKVIKVGTYKLEIIFNDDKNTKNEVVIQIKKRK